MSSGDDRRQDGSEHAPARVVVGLLADPDLPASIARRLAEDLPELLTRSVSDRVTWEVEAVCDPFEATMPESDRLINKAKGRVRGTNWDLAIGITDMPVRDKDRVAVAEISSVDRVALLSLPALGGLRLRHRATAAIVPIIDFLTPDIPRADGTGAPDSPRFRPRRFGSSHSTRLVKPDDDEVDTEVVAARRSGSVRLLAGIVRANRPWQLVLGLSTALAGALTGAAFGVLYSTMWQLGAALSPVRLTVISLGAVATWTLWLIVNHDLWERGPAWEWRITALRLRNLGMLLTVGFGAMMFFLALFAITTTAAAVVIPPEYLASQLERPVNWLSYPRIGLMASVLGTVAGAVGSGLEDEETVRRTTYGKREQERWREVRRDQQ
jgi:hypothetical protein